MRLSDSQRLHWLRLIRSENVGPATFRQLINRFGSAEEALSALPELAARGGARGTQRIATVAEAEAELDAARACGARFVAIGEEDYPANLRAVDGPPPLLAMKGAAAPASARPVAIVGSRNASVAGMRLARRLASELGEAGHGIASGLARGIDRAAHEGSLATGTVAALAGGLDMPYPPENLDLYEAIPANGGCLVSEMPFGREPRARDFPRRNRLIAGMALGLVVVEAAHRSGSLISARLANEMGRLVFAVPGSPLDPRSAGTNGLIRQGATLVTGAQDILEALAPLDARMPPDAMSEPAGEDDDFASAPAPDDDMRARITAALGPTPVHVDDIIRHTGAPPAQVALVLLELELAGRLERHSGGAVSLLLIDP
ncbi:MAG: DNA-protecting protein DprA [Brucellaceae bacterium]|nr:DNA-protecting protein DprA [Brucellaceae bacterium]